MTHLDEETLAQWALSDTEPSHEAAEHLSSCQSCQHHLTELRYIAELTHDLPDLEAPRPEVWQRITAELGVPDDSSARPSIISAPARPADGGHGVAPAESPDGADATGRTPVRRARDGAAQVSRRTLVLAASVTAILGLGAGVIGTRLIDRSKDDVTTQAAIKLEPLEGKSGTGTADLVRVGTADELRVSAAGLTAASGFYEVWLINQDGKRMLSLGVLAPGTSGSYQIPPDVTAQGYRIVDVSLEPNDGNPAHSLDSIIRGTLPA